MLMIYQFRAILYSKIILPNKKMIIYHYKLNKNKLFIKIKWIIVYFKILVKIKYNNLTVNSFKEQNKKIIIHSNKLSKLLLLKMKKK